MKNTIIIFDDDTEILQICSIILESKGFRVVTEASCDNVAEKILSAGADVIMMDNSIPKDGGITATKIIKETAGTRHLPVIFFSANSNVASLSQQAGAEYYLAKPFDIKELETMVDQALNQTSRVAS
jgi:DNA-binding NtrC family response regulator